MIMELDLTFLRDFFLLKRYKLNAVEFVQNKSVPTGKIIYFFAIYKIIVGSKLDIKKLIYQ